MGLLCVPLGVDSTLAFTGAFSEDPCGDAGLAVEKGMLRAENR